MRKLFVPAVFFAGACGAAPTGVDLESMSGDAAVVEKKGETRKGLDPINPVVCIQQTDEAECPDKPKGPIVVL